ERLIGVSLEPLAPSYTEVAVEPVPAIVQRRIGSVPSLVVPVSLAVADNVIVDVGEVGERSPLRQLRIRPCGYGQKLQADVVRLSTGLRGREDRKIAELGISLDRCVDVALELGHRKPGPASTTLLAIVAEREIVWFVWPL